MPVLTIFYMKNRSYLSKLHWAWPTVQADARSRGANYSRHKTTSALRYLIFGSIFISSFQGASYNQDRFNSSKSPVIMILKIKTQVIVSPKFHE